MIPYAHTPCSIRIVQYKQPYLHWPAIILFSVSQFNYTPIYFPFPCNSKLCCTDVLFFQSFITYVFTFLVLICYFSNPTVLRYGQVICDSREELTQGRCVSIQFSQQIEGQWRSTLLRGSCIPLLITTVFEYN